MRSDLYQCPRTRGGIFVGRSPTARPVSDVCRFPRLLALALLLVALAVGSTAHAAPDLSTSSIRWSPEVPVEGELTTATVLVRNSGGPLDTVHVTIDGPLMGFLASVTGLDTPRVDHAQHRITGTVDLRERDAQSIDLTILAPRDSAGNSLNLTVRLDHYPGLNQHHLHSSATINRAPSLRTGLTPAGTLVLGILLVSTSIAWAIRHRYARKNARHMFIASGLMLALCLGLGLLFATMAWRDYRMLTAWPETRCEVLGGRFAQITVHSASNGPIFTRQTQGFVPVLGLRHDIDGRSVHTSGYGPDSWLLSQRPSLPEQAGEWRVGSTIPCWYAPDNPKDVVVVSGFGGAYLFALLILLPLALLMGTLRQHPKR